MTSKKLKLSFIWNVWNTYEDVLLGSEILIEENKRLSLFDTIHCISLGGFESPPSERESNFSTHYHVEYPRIPLTNSGPSKFKGIFRVFEGLKMAYSLALSRGDDYALVTNADAWYLDINKLHGLLSHKKTLDACISCRVGILTSLRSNSSPLLPMTDDHFVILNIKECQKYQVFEYDENVQFYHSLLGHIGSMHNLFYQFLVTRVPSDKLFVYSNLTSSIGQYGDRIGWNLLPWQLELENMLLHANCAQKNELHYLRAELMRSLNFDRFNYMNEYCQRYPLKKSPYRIAHKKNFPLRRRTLKRFFHDHSFFILRKFSSYLNFTLTKYPNEGITLNHRKNFRIYPTEFLN